MHGKITTNDGPNPILYRSTQRGGQRGIPPGKDNKYRPPSKCRLHKLVLFTIAKYQVGSMLINRVADTGVRWHQEVTNAAPRVTPIIDLTLDDVNVKRAIDNLNFIQLRRKYINNFVATTSMNSNSIKFPFPKPPETVTND